MSSGTVPEPWFVARCASCSLRVGTAVPLAALWAANARDGFYVQVSTGHKMGCSIHNAWGNSLPRRDPGRSIRRPDRALWPEVLHARRTKQYRHPRST